MAKASWHFGYLFSCTLVPDYDKLVRSRLGQSHLTRSTNNLADIARIKMWCNSTRSTTSSRISSTWNPAACTMQATSHSQIHV